MTTRISSSLVVVAVGAAAAAAPAPAAAPVATTVKAASLHTASYVNKGSAGVVFRTDHSLARGRNGGTIRGSVSVAGHASSSLGSARGKGARPCYVGYLKTAGLKLGRRYKVTFTLGEKRVTRTLELTQGVAADDRGGALGC